MSIPLKLITFTGCEKVSETLARVIQEKEKGLEGKGLGPLRRCSYIFTEMDLRGFRGNLWRVKRANYHVRLGLLFYAWMD